MSKKKFQETVKKGEGFIFSEGTHNYQALLSKSYDLIINFNIRTHLRTEIEKALGNPKGESAERAYFYNELPEYNIDLLSSLWNDDVFYFFEDLTPKGYYFGTSEGDGSCFGWFKSE